ncbi:polyribonucleotide nucleotidyltransferase [Patescibacteria group bacterium]|nr:polyribonucleotide nucleotidyltransferase [Patescibacteria group bacterium]
MEPKIVSFDLAGRDFSLKTGELAQQAHGAVVASLGDTVVLATTTMGDAREGTDFFPLMCDYEEKFYASGKISGSRFIKREGRPSDKAILTSRLIDRPLRPLFPKMMRNDVQVICSVLSADMEVDPGTTAITAASAALMISGMPFGGPIAAVRIGMADGQFVVNPTYEQEASGDLNLVVAGTEDAITMVEAGANEVSEEKMLEALDLAHKNIKQLCQLQKDLAAQVEIEAKEHVEQPVNEEADRAIAEFVKPEDLDVIQGWKTEVKKQMHDLEDKVLSHFASQIEEGIFTKKDLKEALDGALKKRMRANILEKGIRLDGRKPDEIRPISCKTGILPRTHGSALFQRGETQALTTTTLAGPGAAQLIDTMDQDSTRRYMHHYNFPPYSVGEARPLRGTSRREIGHGYLAERALERMIPDTEKFAYTMRLVSEILTCNGSSSMASVCGSTLSLMDAGVPIKEPVSGIAMGLVTENDGGKLIPGGKYIILSDIQGAEDFAGDMDFKVTGTKNGITALQMDIKVKGLTVDIMREALAKAKEGRGFIMGKMLEALPEARAELSKYAPLISNIQINPDKIKIVIGKGGETIHKITAECDVEIDINDDGLVVVTAPDQEKGDKAVKWIKDLTADPVVGNVYDGKVVRIMDFGAFVEFMPGKDGLVHISQLAKERVNKVEDVVKLGDPLEVKLMEIDDQGRNNLSHKATL